MCPMPEDGRDPEDETALTRDDERRAEEGSALAPEELDIEQAENVVSLDRDRYVIGTDDRPDVPDDAGRDARAAGADRGETESEAEPAQTAAAVDSGTVKGWLESDLESVSAQYGFHVTAKAEDSISHQQMFSDDVGTVFDSLLRWYAQQLTTETAVEDVLGILLTESNVRVRYSPSCLQAILEAYDLGPEDTIADLFEAVQDDRGMVFPPENV